ncbi:hypothetical protein [Culicoidibacter larvae]|uniref:Uncharacterized protein n=1 Tax=Culicoidibacter larvae TaxID=2579976 RepID=A0A5R8Q949_9FIRM|nr:hypothetical protein [Culicoidibacter larvae]TLG71775.1 hypothetical protein FEZ08_10225 [Culicoidibacter larvae]
MRKKLLAILCLVPLLLFLQNLPVHATIPTSRAEASEAAMAALEKIEDRAGTYEVKLVYEQNGRTITETVLMTITAANTVIQEPIAIDAQNVIVALADVSQMSATDWITLAQAHAWNTQTLADLNVQADTSSIQNKVGVYPITFVTDNGVATTIQAEVQDLTASGENAAVIYQANMKNGWHETSYQENKFMWANFGNWFDITISGVLLLGFAIPITILIIEYVVTKQIIQKLIDVLGK